MRSVSSAVALVWALAVSAGAQARQIGRPIATHPAEWTQVARVRELPDGRVLVVDFREQVLKVADFKSGTATLVGGKGHGPNEYVMPTAIYPLPGDSSVLFDEANGASSMLIDPKGKPTGMMTAARPGSPLSFLTAFSDVDGTGSIYRASPISGPDGISPIERFNRQTRRIDTAAYFSRRAETCARDDGRASTERPQSGQSGRERVRGSQRPYPSIEEWAVAPDGRVAVACPSPYHVKFIGPNGRRVVGPVIPYVPVKVTNAEKKAWRDERAAPVAVLRFGANGSTSASFERRPVVEPDEWPDHLPAFRMLAASSGSRTVQFAPDGMLWVTRMVAAAANPSYDVIGPDGKLAYRVTLPARSHIVGFGAKGIYAVQTDQDDIQRLQLLPYPLPGK